MKHVLPLKLLIFTISLFLFYFGFFNNCTAGEKPPHLTIVPITTSRAVQATTADYADEAGYAEEAGHADEADVARQAGHAIEADHADTATSAESAVSAETADTLSPNTCDEGHILQKGVDKWYCVEPNFAMAVHAYDSAGQYLGVVVDYFARGGIGGARQGDFIIFIPGLNVFTNIPEINDGTLGVDVPIGPYGDIAPCDLWVSPDDYEVYIYEKSFLTRNYICDSDGCQNVFRISTGPPLMPEPIHRYCYKTVLIDEADIPFERPVTLPIIFKPYAPLNLP